MKKSLIVKLFVVIVTLFGLNEAIAQRWSVEKAQKWYAEQDWIVGCNFIPSTADNTLEMWQAETFDSKTIMTELGYAKNLGFNTVRVFLHYLVWMQDPSGFKVRLDYYLWAANLFEIKTIFVLFDDCWNKNPQLGPQPDPIPGVHNSQWVQCPGDKEVANKTLYQIYSGYVHDILETFKSDPRVLLWDLYNEPGNSDHYEASVSLLGSVFAWARDIDGLTQPVASGMCCWDGVHITDIYSLIINNSDIFTFHDYSNIHDFANNLKYLQSIIDPGRPMICSEYMARTIPSRFETHLPFMKDNKIGAINWGLVDGRTQTKFPWGSPPRPNPPEPNPWFHDILHKNGTPYNTTEFEIIRNLTMNKGVQLSLGHAVQVPLPLE